MSSNHAPTSSNTPHNRSQDRPSSDAAAQRVLVAIPVFNEQRTVRGVVERVLHYCKNVVLIDDGSTDQTPEILRSLPVTTLRHPHNQGYGASLIDAFGFAQARGYDWVITMDCDEQHEPGSIPAFIDLMDGPWDIISGSRYLASLDENTSPPADRRAINRAMTEELNARLGARLGLTLTDSFCGFKAHRVAPLRKMSLSQVGYAFPMQLWVQAAALGLSVVELPVKLIYKDLTRSFGAALDDPGTRLQHYRQVLHCELQRWTHLLPEPAVADVLPCGE